MLGKLFLNFCQQTFHPNYYSFTIDFNIGSLSILVIATSFCSLNSIATVLQNLVYRLNRQWTKLGKYWQKPTRSSISAARQKIE